MVPRSALAALAALAIALLTGCGGGGEEGNAYVDEVNAAQTEFAQTVDRLSRSITKRSSAREDRRTLNRFERAIDGVVADLRAIQAPDVVQAEHARLVEAMSGFGTEVEQATAALREPDRRSLRRAQATLAAATATVSRRINAAIAAINSKLGAA